MKIIDAHIHFSSQQGFAETAKRAGYENTAEQLASAFKKENIVMAVAMGTAYENREAGYCLPRTINLCGPLDLDHYNQPDFITYCAGMDSNAIVQARMNETLEAFERHFRSGRCVGLKMYPGYDHYYVSDPIYEPFYDLAEDYDIPVVIHTGDTSRETALVKYAHPLTVDDVAVRHPKLRFVIAHYGNPWIIDATEVAQKNRNVFIDLSGLVEGDFSCEEFCRTQKSYLEYMKMWLTYLSDYQKFMYGSDWPLVNLDAYIQLIAHLVPERCHEDVFYHNAKRVFPKLNAFDI